MAGGYPEYRMGYINDRRTIAHLDGIWHDIKVEFDESGNVVYRAVHELSGQPADSDFWCVWKYTYDSHNRPTRIEGPLCGKYGWEDKTSGSYWTTSGQPYDSGWYDVLEIYYDFTLTATGGWESGYRPDKIRITFTGTGPIKIGLYDSAFQLLFPTDAYLNSGESADITYAGNDLKYLDFLDTDNDFKITKIEFGYNPFK